MGLRQRSIGMVIVTVIIVVIVCGYIIIDGLIISRTTGILSITTPKGSNVALYKRGYDITSIATTSTQVRVAPGNYEVFITGSTQLVRFVTIHKMQTSKLNISSLLTSPKPQSYTYANELIKLLPIIGPASSYEINYSYQYTNTGAIPSIIITAATPAAQQQALLWITSQGFNPSALKISYVTQTIEEYNYTNGAP